MTYLWFIIEILVILLIGIVVILLLKGLVFCIIKLIEHIRNPE